MKRLLLYGVAILLLCSLLSACTAGTPDADQLRKQAQAALAGTDTAQAVSACAAWAEAQPSSEEALRALAAAYAAQPQDAEALAGEISSYEALYNMGVYTQEDFLTAAALYEQANEPKLRRNVLEIHQKLYYTAEVQALLDTITLDAADENEEIRAQLANMAQLLQNEDADGAVTLATDTAFLKTILPRLTYGARRYRFTTEAGDTLLAKISVSNGQYAAQLWLQKAGGALVQLEASSARILFYKVADGTNGFSGAYTMQLLQASTGDVIMENGTLAAGICTGDITSSVYWGDSAVTDMAGAWQACSSREFIEYTGSFDAAGHTTVTQQKDAESANGIVYASVKSGNTLYYLYHSQSEAVSAADYVFTAEGMGLVAVPVWE